MSAQQITTKHDEIEAGPKAWTGRQTRIVTVKGKRYCVEATITKHKGGSYVRYWSERGGQAVGATRSCGAHNHPGTVGRAIWDIVSR